jgi:hypothetical protein
MAQLYQCIETGLYDAWLTTVFEKILFTPEVESGFREKLTTILTMSPESNYEVNFKDMPTRSPAMLELLNALKGINIDKAKSNQIKKVGELRYNLLYPLREFIANKRVEPSATHVLKIYDKSTIDDYLLMLVKYVLLNNILKTPGVNPALMKIVNEPANYDDAVREEIGRILLEWNKSAPPQLGGRSTRKHKRVCRLNNANTRTKPRLMTNKRSTRQKRRASGRRCNRTRRN